MLLLPKRYASDFSNPNVAPVGPVEIDYRNPVSKGLIAYYSGDISLKGLGPEATVMSPVNSLFCFPSYAKNGEGSALLSIKSTGSSTMNAGLHPTITGTQPFTFMLSISMVDLVGAALTNRQWGGTNITTGFIFRFIDDGDNIEFILNSMGTSTTDRATVTLPSTFGVNDRLSMVGTYHPSDKIRMWAKLNKTASITAEAVGTPVGTYADGAMFLCTNAHEFYLHHATLWNRALTDAEARGILDDPYQILKPANQPVYFPVGGAASTFQAAWAANSNVLIQVGM